MAQSQGASSETATVAASPRPKSKLYLSALAEALRLLGKRIKPDNVVEHLLHDDRFNVLFPSHDGRSIGDDCRDCAEEIVGNAVALRALRAAPVAEMMVNR